MPTPLPDYGLAIQEPVSSTVKNSLAAEEIAKIFLQNQIQDPNYNHEIPFSQLWAYKKDNTFHLISTHPDVYGLLSEDYDITSYVAILIHTTGWAAPLNDQGEVDVPPSQNSLRRRVALASCVSSGSVGSALSFSDDKEMIIDPGSATGSLAESLIEFWRRNTNES